MSNCYWTSPDVPIYTVHVLQDINNGDKEDTAGQGASELGGEVESETNQEAEREKNVTKRR